MLEKGSLLSTFRLWIEALKSKADNEVLVFEAFFSYENIYKDNFSSPKFVIIEGHFQNKSDTACHCSS